jgi:hypothetical protein
MLRAGVLLFSCLAVGLGLYLCATGCAATGGIQTLIGGAVILLATLFERWRYNNTNASGGNDWQPTGERFVDPATGKNVEVLYDPHSGERRYRTTGEGTTRPD